MTVNRLVVGRARRREEVVNKSCADEIRRSHRRQLIKPQLGLSAGNESTAAQPAFCSAGQEVLLVNGHNIRRVHFLAGTSLPDGPKELQTSGVFHAGVVHGEHRPGDVRRPV